MSRPNGDSPPRMRGATASVAGSRGIVPKPTAGQHNFMLLGDGTWGAQPVAGLPSQTSNSGKLLTTDGTNAAWTTTAVLTSLTSPASIDLTLAGGSSGASLVLGQGASGVGLLTVPDTNDTRALSLKQSTNTATAHLGLFSNSLYIGQNYYYSTGNVIPNAIRTSGAIVISTGTTANSGNIDFNLGTVNTAPSTLARLTGTGNLLIGTTTDMTGSGGLKIAGTTAASTTTSGALQVAGGIAVSKQSYFEETTGAGVSLATFYTNQNTAVTNGHVYVNSNDTLAAFDSLRVRQAGTGNILKLVGTAAAGTVATVSSSGITSLTNSTASTGSTSGALQVAGGIYAGAASYINGQITTSRSAQDVVGARLLNSNAGSNTGSVIELAGPSKAAYLISLNDGRVFLHGNAAPGQTSPSETPFLSFLATGAATFAGAVSVSGTAATWTSGTGSPESVKTAPVGSLYTRTDGGASTTLYVKESGAGNTGWIAK